MDETKIIYVTSLNDILLQQSADHTNILAENSTDIISHASITENSSLFSEIIWEPEDTEECRIEKEKTAKKPSKRFRNKKLRMLGQEYTGFRRAPDERVLNDSIKPARKLGAPCNSSSCASSNVINCEKFTESVRMDIFKEFWKMNWAQKKMFVSSLVEKQPIKKKITQRAVSRRGITKVYYLKLNNEKLRVCLKTFLGTLGIKEWTARQWLGENYNKDTRMYLKAIPKLPSNYNTERK